MHPSSADVELGGLGKHQGKQNAAEVFLSEGVTRVTSVTKKRLLQILANSKVPSAGAIDVRRHAQFLILSGGSHHAQLHLVHLKGQLQF